MMYGFRSWHLSSQHCDSWYLAGGGAGPQGAEPANSNYAVLLKKQKLDELAAGPGAESPDLGTLLLHFFVVCL